MKLNSIFLPVTDPVSRAVNTLYSDVNRALTAMSGRPKFYHQLETYTTLQTLTTTTSYQDLVSLGVPFDSSIDDSNLVAAVAMLRPASGDVYSLQLVRDTTSLVEVPDIAGDGVVVVPFNLIAVDKPTSDVARSFYKLQLKRPTGSGDCEYSMLGLFAVRGWS